MIMFIQKKKISKILFSANLGISPPPPPPPRTSYEFERTIQISDQSGLICDWSSLWAIMVQPSGKDVYRFSAISSLCATTLLLQADHQQLCWYDFMSTLLIYFMNDFFFSLG